MIGYLGFDKFYQDGFGSVENNRKGRLLLVVFFMGKTVYICACLCNVIRVCYKI